MGNFKFVHSHNTANHPALLGSLKLSLVVGTCQLDIENNIHKFVQFWCFNFLNIHCLIFKKVVRAESAYNRYIRTNPALC